MGQRALKAHIGSMAKHGAIWDPEAFEGSQMRSQRVPKWVDLGPILDPFWTPFGGVRRAAELCEVPDVERCGPRGPQATHWEHREHTPPRSAEAIPRVPNRVPGRPPE